MWIARDEFGVSLHRTEPVMKPVADDDLDPRSGDMAWSSEDSFLPDGLDESAGDWLIAELGKDMDIGIKAKVRIALVE